MLIQAFFSLISTRFIRCVYWSLQILFAGYLLGQSVVAIFRTSVLIDLHVGSYTFHDCCDYWGYFWLTFNWFSCWICTKEELFTACLDSALSGCVDTSYSVVMHYLPGYVFVVILICASVNLSISNNTFTKLVYFNLLHNVMMICA